MENHDLSTCKCIFSTLSLFHVSMLTFFNLTCFPSGAPYALRTIDFSSPSTYHSNCYCVVFFRTLPSIISALAEKEAEIQKLSKDRTSSTAPPQAIGLSTFIESHNATSSSRPRLPLQYIESNDLAVPAAMPGLSSSPQMQPSNGPAPYEYLNNDVQSSMYWDQAVANLCMPKGSLLPLAPVNTGSGCPPTADAMVLPFQYINAGVTYPGFPARTDANTTLDQSGTKPNGDADILLASIVNVPKITTPTLPIQLHEVKKQMTTSQSSKRTTSSPACSDSSIFLASGGKGEPSTAGTSPEVVKLTKLPKKPKRTSPATNQQETVQVNCPPHQTSSDHQAAFQQPHHAPNLVISQKVETPTGYNGIQQHSLSSSTRRLSIVSTPRRGSVSVGSPAGTGQLSSGQHETEKFLHLPTMPSLVNLRINTSTIRGRRQQKKMNVGSASTTQPALPTDNALGLSAPSITLPLPTSASADAANSMLGPSEPKVSDSSSSMGNLSVSNLMPGNIDFQPSAAANMPMQTLPRAAENGYPAVRGDVCVSSAHQQSISDSVMPIYPSPILEGNYHRHTIPTSQQHSGMGAAEVLKTRRQFRSYDDATRHLSQAAYQNQPSMPSYTYSTGVPTVPSMYPASLPYLPGYPYGNHQMPTNMSYETYVQPDDPSQHKRKMPYAASSCPAPGLPYSYTDQNAVYGPLHQAWLDQQAISSFNFLAEHQYPQLQSANPHPSLYGPGPGSIPIIPTPASASTFAEHFPNHHAMPTFGDLDGSRHGGGESPTKRVRLDQPCPF